MLCAERFENMYTRELFSGTLVDDADAAMMMMIVMTVRLVIMMSELTLSHIPVESFTCNLESDFFS